MLDRLPSIIRDTDFDSSMNAKVGDKTLVPAYVASQLGFSETGRKTLDEFYKKLKSEAEVFPLCPFTACGEYLDLARLGELKSLEEEAQFWNSFNDKVGPVNYGELMPRSKFMIAILDGGHAVDDGVAAEIGYYAGKYGRPIVGIRSDFRLGENPQALINPAVRYFLDKGPYGGFFFAGADAYKKGMNCIKKLAKAAKT